MKQTNILKLKGTIVRMELKKQSIYYYLAVQMGTKRYFPSVIEVLKEPITPENVRFLPGDRVSIQGHIQDRKQIRNDSKTVYSKSLVVDTMEACVKPTAETLSVHGVESMEEDHDINQVLIVGRITHFYKPRPNITILTVSVKENGHFNFCEITCFEKQSKIADAMNEGAEVAIVAEVHTTDKYSEEGKDIQNIVCMDISPVIS